MFGFGKKKKLDEFTTMLAEFANISEKEARAYVDKNQIRLVPHLQIFTQSST